MKDFDADLVLRSLATLGEKADKKGTVRRKARFMASIARVQTDPAERARIAHIAADAGIPGQAAGMPFETPEDLTSSQDRSYAPGPTRGITRILRRIRRSRQTPREWGHATRVGHHLAWLGGGDKAILEQVPEGRTSFVQMALVLLTTAGIAAISMMFALHDGVGASLPAAVGLGLLWGAVILNIDRFLVLSMTRTRNLRQSIMIALPRLALAAVLAAVISTPLVLRIFASDINAELLTLHQQSAAYQSALIDKSPQAQEAAQIQEQINADQAILAGHLPLAVTTPQLQTAQSEVNQLTPHVEAARTDEANALAAWQCEVNGSGPCSAGTSGLVGNGPLAKAKQMIYEQALETYNSLQAQLNSAETALSTAERSLGPSEAGALARYQASARTALPGLQAQEQKLQEILQRKSANASTVTNADNGILAQLQALSEVSAKNPSLEAARWTILALFFVIEILPVTVKFLLNLGPASTYEAVAEQQGRQLADLARMQRNTERRIEEAKAQIRIKMETDMRGREEELAKRVNQQVAAEMAKILDQALQEWGNEVHAKLFPDGEHMDPTVAEVLLATRPEIWAKLKAVS